MIYLHMFSLTADRYMDFPQFFGGHGAALRVILPQAPMRPQPCYDTWWEWNSRRGRHELKRHTAWFDYLTDSGGVRENRMDVSSLRETRQLLHAIIEQEVRRTGDPRRVIVGGSSQGCCTALDAAFTYPQTLGGVIGLVGNLLDCTPIAGKDLPVFLFQEASDREMRWSWVRKGVARMRRERCNLTLKRERDPSGGGHFIGHVEGLWVRSALRKIITPCLAGPDVKPARAAAAPLGV